MNKGIRVGLAASKLLRLVIAVIPLLLACRAFNAKALTETNLHSFVGSPSDGRSPAAGLVQGSDGYFYGTTFNGGTSTNCTFGCGTVFRISPDGSETNLYSFVGSPNDGRSPEAGLVQGNDGNFYGTTELGGTSNSGTVFRISPSGNYTNLYSFGSSPKDGVLPYAGLVEGSDGNFYGTTVEGGTSTNCTYGCGIVFRISPGGTYTNLHSFVGSPKDGQSPYAVLVQGSDGNFYGVTYAGGASTNCYCGTVFRISPSGSETNLYSFGGYPKDGASPSAGLVRGSDGNFYGTTSQGGTSNKGIVLRISPSGNYTNLYSFGSSPTDGQSPRGLVQGSDGNFYGTTQSGGTNGSCSCGTVFRINPGGIETILYSFSNSPSDGYEPYEPVQGSDGNFYGMTVYGGTNNYGIVFKLTVPLNPPANQISAVHVATPNIIFTIPSIGDEIYQLQFSTSMNPTNWVNVPAVPATKSIGGMLTLTNFGAAVWSQGYYRFDITP